ncbi:hypothetical protein C0992_005662 [Termitomyces sp. T32_za158]|nr:hypothetical protein C0992_005662 [Termitomyces sp. T32_za158]
MSYERVRTKEDILEELHELHELHPIAPDHDSPSTNTYRSIPMDSRILYSQVSGYQHPGRPQDDVADFEQLTYHTVSVEKLCSMFDTAADRGLDHAVAAHNIRRYGKNTIDEKKPMYLGKLIGYLFGNFCSILWVAAIVFLASWKPLDGTSPTNLALAILIICVILSQASFFAFQDWSTSQIINSILKLLPSECIVIREGKTIRMPTADLAVGDVVILSTGNRVPADIRLIETSDDVRFDRAVLTGESEEVEGNVDCLGETFLKAPNIALMGTHFTNGCAKGVVVLTGGLTVMGRISKLMYKTPKKPTLIQQEIWRFVRIIVFLTVAFVLCILVSWFAWLRNYHDGFINGVEILNEVVGCIVAFIPEGLPVAVTLTLSLIARRMKKVSVLPKSLSTVETLGCVTVICSDKTGTLTWNQMSVISAGFVDKTYTAQEFRENFTNDLTGRSAVQQLHRAATLCNGATFDTATADLPLEQRGIGGNATDGAILRFVESFGDAPTVRASEPQVYQIPFNSRNKWMLTIHNSSSSQDPEKKPSSLIFVKGAPDVLIPSCTSYYSALTNDIQPFDSVARAKLINTQEKWSRAGQRVILLCTREYTPYHTVGTNYSGTEISKNGLEELTVVGLLGLMDPPRHESAVTVKDCRKAGVRFFMVTGDFGLTATAIARQVGIITSPAEPDSFADVVSQIQGMPIGPLSSCRDPDNRIPKSLMLEGKDLVLFTEGHWDIATRYEEIVFARTTPEQKLDIVTAFKKRDNVVAVTGDGVNDAPALRAADIGIAVSSGSDVAVEAADLVILNNFDSIVGGIRLGRLVFQNLQKVVAYLLPAGSWSEVWPIIVNVYFGVPIPLSPFLMIIICCFTDLFSCLSLIFEKDEFDLLTLPPRNHKKDHLINLKIYGQAYFFMGIMETVIAHAMFFFYYSHYHDIPISRLFLSFDNTLIDKESHFVAQCVYFVTLVILQWGNLLSIRNKRLSILQADPFRKQRRNPLLFVGMILSFVIAIIVTEVPKIQKVFSTRPVPLLFWLIPLPLALAMLIMDEIRKLLVRTYPKGFLARIAW